MASMPAGYLPPDKAVSDDTLPSDANPEKSGPWTDQLSEVSEDEADAQARTASHNAVSTFIRRMQPLVKSKRVQGFAIANCILTLLNLIALIAAIVLWTMFLINAISVSNRNAIDKPCFFEWTEWSECSATCRLPMEASMPVKTRRVKSDSIIQPRGKFTDKVPCPANLNDLLDTAPCNTAVCAQNLSSFNFVGPFKKFDNYGTMQCYKIRDVPRGDFLINIDTTDMVEYVPCA